jgi:hypothetical protein
MVQYISYCARESPAFKARQGHDDMDNKLDVSAYNSFHYSEAILTNPLKPKLI